MTPEEQNKIFEMICSNDQEIKELAFSCIKSQIPDKSKIKSIWITCKYLEIESLIVNLRNIGEIRYTYQIGWLMQIFKNIDDINNYYETNH